MSKNNEDAKKVNPMQEVYEYHGTTKKEFDKLYENIPDHIKAYQKEVMVVEFYNQGQKIDWNDSNQYKYYPWFDMNIFLFLGLGCYDQCSPVTARLCFLRKEDCIEAVEKFIDIYRESRLS